MTKSSPPVYHLSAAFAAAGQGFIPTPGDVVVNETATAQISSDLLRFDANGNLTVFSDIETNDVPPFDLADLRQVSRRRHRRRSLSLKQTHLADRR